MNNVLYLSYSERGDGLVFPNELEKDIYSLGIWVVKTSSDLPTKINFDAVYNNELITLKAEIINKNIYKIDTKSLGVILCRAVKVHYRHNKYVGRSKEIQETDTLYQLVPMNISLLEKLCLEDKFYLVGKIDEQIG